MISWIFFDTNRAKRLSIALVLLISMPILPCANAHVGSSGVILQKQAGKYQLLVSIQPPDVVPGTAKVTVFVEQGRVSSIGARPIFFRSGDKGAPTHDELTPTGTGRFEGDLWLMDSGSSSIELTINGPDGRQRVVVPVMSVATAMRTMPEGTGIGLALMALLLIVMMITIVGASNADGITKPGQPVPSLARRRWVGMGAGAIVLALLLTGWRSWWTSSAEQYRTEQLYRPLRINASVSEQASSPKLTIRIDTSGFEAGAGGRRRRVAPQARRLMSFVIPDHGKLMHTFLVRVPGLDAFAHLHPTRPDSLTYETALPPLPAGKYLLYSDIVFRSGFAETLTDTITITSEGQTKQSAAPTLTNNTPHPAMDRDDSWAMAKPMGIKTGAENLPHLDNGMVVCGKPGASTKLADGSSMLWMDKPGGPSLEAGQLYTLKFAVADAQGKPAPLEPYLGMGGHAVILRSDGSVYIHLHPVGTYSMAAEGSFVGRLADTARSFRYPDANQFRDSIDRYVARLSRLPEAEKNKLLMAGMPAMSHTMPVNNMVEFPYAFPRAGHYRIWIQVKRNGQVLTGVFDTEVKEALL